MKLFAVFAFVLFASSVSGSFFKRKQPKVVDIHIRKGIPSQPSQPAPIPVGQAPFIAYLPQSYFTGGQFVPVNHVQVGHVRVGHVPVSRAPVGKVHGSLSVPVVSQHSVQVVPVHVNAPYLQPQLVSVEPSVQAVQLLFKSASSPLLVKQKHFGSQGAVYESTQSEDYPHVLRHVVHKPVVQEVRQIIQPYRSITTQIQPVQERVHTILPVRKGQLNGFVQQSGQVHFPYEHFRQEQPEALQAPVKQQPPTKQPPVQEPIEQEPIQQEPVQQEPIEQEPEPIEQQPVKGHFSYGSFQ